jgi:hypothetical protein
MNTDIEYDDLNIYDINSILGFIKEKYIQIFLLLLVPIIIYIVDHISNINAVIFGLPSPVITASQPPPPEKNSKMQEKFTKKRKGPKK